VNSAVLLSVIECVVAPVYCLAVCCVKCVSGCASQQSRKLHPTHISSLFSCGTGLALFVFSSDIPIEHCNVVDRCFRH